MRYAKVLVTALLVGILLSAIPIIVIAVSAPWLRTEIVSTETTEPTQEDLIDDPILYSEVGYQVPVSYEEAMNQVEVLHTYIEELETASSSELYSEDAIIAMKFEAERLHECLKLYESDIDRFCRWMEEYPVATDVWFYLRKQGLSESVVAGIIGNMMIETGGQTLKLRPKVYSSSGGFYGLCQWSMKYYPKARDLDTYGQLEFLLSTIKREFDKYGFVYKKNFTYEDFLSLESPKDVALAFAKVYERCGSGSYNARKKCAQVAYNYFVLGE